MARAPIDKQTLHDVAATVGSHKEFRDHFDIAPPTVLRWKMQYNLDLPDADWITARRIDIRNRREAGESYQSIANDYDVSRQMIYNIYRRDKLRLVHEAVNT